MNSGSVESLKLSLRCGAKAKARHTRCTLLRLRPQAAASERVLQCVACFGMDSTRIFNLFSPESSRCCRSWLIHQAVNALIQKAAAPFANRLLGHAQPRRDLGITLALGTRQNDARPLGQRLDRLRSPRPLLQRLAF